MSARLRTSRRTSSANGNGGGKWCWPTTRLAVYLRDGLCCLYCERDLHGANPHDITLDHVRCRSASERTSHKSTNLVTCCRRCNSKRQNKPLRAFLTSLYFELYTMLKDTSSEGTCAWLVEEAMKRINRNRKRNIRRYAALAKSLIEERSVARAQENSQDVS